MLKRPVFPLSWPRILGLACGTFGGAVAAGTAVGVLAAGSVRGQTVPSLIIAIVGAVFLFLAFPLYAAREWARRAVILVTYCSLGALAIFLSANVFQHSLSSPSSGLFRFAIGLSALVSVLTPPAFLLAVLHHSDVRHAFQAQKASNQTLEVTATR